MGWEVEGRFKREETYVYLWLIHVDVILQLKNKLQKREETYVYLGLIHVGLWQKPTQHCKAVILQLKIKFKKKEKSPSLYYSLQSESVSCSVKSNSV